MQIELEQAKELFVKIYDDQKLVSKIEQELIANSDKYIKYLLCCTQNKWNKILKLDAFTKLCVCYAFLPITKRLYQAKSIDDSIFFDTMSDIKIWIDDCQKHTGQQGLEELNWIKLHLDLKIFKLGRLQFQLCKYYFSKHYSNKSIDVNYVDKCLNIHIPRGDSLELDKCNSSINYAKQFFGQYFPDYPTNFFICHSWLLYPNNRLFMSQDSNIIKFANMFDIIKATNYPSQSFKWLFGEYFCDANLIRNKLFKGRYCDYTKLNATSSMQKSAIEYLVKGGKLGDAKGILVCE